MTKGEPAEVYTITEAQRGLSDEQTSRQRKYLISMGIRTACVLGAILVPGWPRWAFIVGAVVLPYLAVVIANAGRASDKPGDVGVEGQAHAALPASQYVLDSPDTWQDRSWQDRSWQADNPIWRPDEPSSPSR